LISKSLYDLVSTDASFHFVYIGNHVLKGKYQSMELFGVKRVAQNGLPDHYPPSMKKGIKATGSQHLP
jgi:hypothetical protein